MTESDSLRKTQKLAVLNPEQARAPHAPAPPAQAPAAPAPGGRASPPPAGESAGEHDNR